MLTAYCRVSLLEVVICPWLSCVAVDRCCLSLVVECRCWWLLFVPGCRVPLAVVVVCLWLSGVTVLGCCLSLVVRCQVGGCSLSLVIECRCWWLLFIPGCRVSLTVVVYDPGCRVSLLVVVVCPWLSCVAVGGCCLTLVVWCRLSGVVCCLTVSVGAHLL